MKLRVTIDGRLADLELDHDAGRCHFRYTPEGQAPVEGDASVVEVEPGVYSVLWDDRSFEARVTGDTVEIRGRRFSVQVADPRELSSGPATAADAGPQSITAPMPGKVIRLLAEEGQAVEAGQGIVVVEAMKMQNELQAPKSGLLSSVRVRPGDAVASGQVLAIVG